jgi:hypothetical protein
MNISEAFDFLNFWINKNTGAWYTISELTEIVDRGQMSLYEDLQPRYATSQRIKDALSVFKEKENFTTQISGNIIVTDSRYLNLLDIQIYFQISNRTVYYPLDILNEDVRADRLNSQLDPVTVTTPIAEQVAAKTFRLYPASQYNGNITFLRRPIKPVFAYTVISGRVIVYNSVNSTQLEWNETWHNAILIKALSSIGINLTDSEVAQYAELKSQSNYQTVNMV